VADILVSDYYLSVEQVCRAAGLSRTAWYRGPAREAGDADVTLVLNKLMDRWPR